MGAETSYPDHPVAVVDDEVDFLRVVRRTLGAAGITHVQTYADGRELLAFAVSEEYFAVRRHLGLEVGLP